MALADPAFSQGDVMRRLAALEATVREVAAGRRLEAAQIGSGGVTIRGGSLRVLDDDGSLIAQIGRLPDGGHGVAALNSSGELVTLSTLAFGLKSGFLGGSTDITSTSYADPPDGLGPDLTNVEVGTSRRAIVIVGAVPLAVVGSPYLYAGFRVIRQDTGAVTLPGSDGHSFQGSAFQALYGAAYVRIIEGSYLPVAGLYTFESQYRVSTGTCSVGNRSLTVLPF